jgi:hypothetical protein
MEIPSMSNPVIRNGLHNVLVLTAFLIATCSVSLADVAVLHEKGPTSGSAFSNPGLTVVQDPQPKIQMTSADVEIRLRRGESNQLAADCDAQFLLKDNGPPQTESRKFLAAFPVSGLSTKIVTITNFSVTIDGEQPATVFRRTIVVSKWEAHLQDTAIFGQLEARFQAESTPREWGITLADKSVYRGAYVWEQKTTPGKSSRVHVKYSVILIPQSIHYSKSYARSEGDSEVIPFRDLNIDKWNDQYYFFDYVLMSGSTWDGPIGHETITLTADPNLHFSMFATGEGPRSPVGYHPQKNEYYAQIGMTPMKEYRKWEISGKPDSDLLISIPASAVDLGPPSPSK